LTGGCFPIGLQLEHIFPTPCRELLSAQIPLTFALPASIDTAI
jgi:hypothetical protein